MTDCKRRKGPSRRQVLRASSAAALGMSLPSLFVKPSQAADFTLKYANEQPVAHPTNVRAREAIEKIKAETNGKVEIQLRLEKPDQRTPAWA